MNKLYMVGIGGKAKNTNIEVHDVQFVVGESIDDTYQTIVANWYGISKKLHLDSYVCLEGADGYKISLEASAKNLGKESLYLVNIGGYDENSLLEIHKIGLFVAKSDGEARAKAKKALFADEIQVHIDNVVNVNNSLNTLYGNKYYVKLEETSQEYSQKPDWLGYKRLDNINE